MKTWFAENELDDESLAARLDTDVFAVLADVIPVASLRLKFMQAFTAQRCGGASRQVRLEIENIKLCK